VIALHNVTNEGSAENYQSTKIYASTRPFERCTPLFGDGGRSLGGNDEFVLSAATDQDEALTWEWQDKTTGNTVLDPVIFF
jgi:hypothetical protein